MPRGKNFHVGDRIVMGGFRGDVISVGFMQTVIIEMGQPPGEQADAHGVCSTESPLIGWRWRFALSPRTTARRILITWRFQKCTWPPPLAKRQHQSSAADFSRFPHLRTPA
jgi:hypothetical protein